MKLYLIRGQRIINQLGDLLLETTYNRLNQNVEQFIPKTTKRQYSTDPITIIQLEITPYIGSNGLKFKSLVSSNNKKYNCVLFFSDVVFQSSDQPNNITFVATDQDQYHIIPISLLLSNVKVNCNCLDFKWRFAKYNQNDDSLYGEPPPLYQRITNTRPPVNPKKVPGVCKHIIKTVLTLQQSGLVNNTGHSTRIHSSDNKIPIYFPSREQARTFVKQGNGTDRVIDLGSDKSGTQKRWVVYVSPNDSRASEYVNK